MTTAVQSSGESRRAYLGTVRSVVVKLGTQLLSDGQGRLDTELLGRIAGQVAALRQKRIGMTIVSSGAIGAGMRELHLAKRPRDLAMLQAVAAVGQRRLMDAWADGFAGHKLPVAQLLLTREDVDDRTRYLNVRNTIHAVHELGAIPIINENDTISTDELVKITFGDNDLLAAMVTHALRADVLLLLTGTDGLMDAAGNAVRLIESIDRARELVRNDRSPLGKGGMLSKVESARMVMESGEAIIIADGRMPDVLTRALAGEEVGTLFVPASRKRSSRSRWIGSVRPAGTILVDEGAAKALVKMNRSLLPAGVVGVEGRFERGDVVAIQGPDGREIARGLCNYAAADVQRIRGKKTQEVRAMLEHLAYDEVVHRDNLVVVQ